jgi:hypothetical protein
MEVVSAPEGVDAGFQPVGDAGKLFRLSARMKPQAPYGVLQGRIRFRAVLVSGPFVSRSAPVKALVVDDLYALPSAVLLGAVPVGAAKTALVTLQSHHGEAFAVEAIEGATESLTVQHRDSPSPVVHRYDLCLKPASVGPVAGTLKFRLKTSAGRQYVLTLSVGGYATGPEAH